MSEISTSFIYQFPQIKRMVKSDYLYTCNHLFNNDETDTRRCKFSQHKGGALGGSKVGQNWKKKKPARKQRAVS